MNRTDLADPHTGILASFDRHQPLAVFEPGASGETARFELEADPVGPSLELGDDDLIGAWTVTAQRLRGRLRGGDGSTTPIEAIGASSGRLSAGDSATAAALRRSLVICFEDGGILALIAARPAGAESHGAERVAAAAVDADGEVTVFAQPLLSTEYDGAGHQRRATLELWPQSGGDGPLRGGGSAVAATELELPEAHSTLAFFEWSLGGRPAIGRYEIIRSR